MRKVGGEGNVQAWEAKTHETREKQRKKRKGKGREILLRIVKGTKKNSRCRSRKKWRA